MTVEELTTQVSTHMYGKNPCPVDVDNEYCKITPLAVRLGTIPSGEVVQHVYATIWVWNDGQMIEELHCIYCNKRKEGE